MAIDQPRTAPEDVNAGGEARGADDRTRSTPILEVAGLGVTFGGVRPVDDVSFVPNRGVITGLIGPNGAGKSTLLNVIAGVVRPATGYVAFEGRRLTRATPHSVARLGITRTFQLGGEFGGLTVLENMLMGVRSQRGESVLGALLGPRYWRAQERALITRARELLEECDLVSKQDEYARNLSGGQRRILEILRATMADPKLLLLDEPFAGVNKTVGRRIETYLTSLQEKGMTMIMVEHELASVDRMCEDVLVMARGHIIGRGKMRDLRASHEIRQAYLAG